MMLENNHRERLHMVYDSVKKRLDYQVGLQHLERRLAQEHMVNWVEKSVIHSITPQQEKEASPSVPLTSKCRRRMLRQPPNPVHNYYYGNYRRLN
ncbi:ATP synthase F(0) complex subunit B1, mitochondrial-like [Amblyraja radiata]|uniref:ATP synthase F(0) complex subunit B1, mitochondrial-like n=1 Tax=Amblyraja radiata TaxID=386614 RepID=UPI001401CC9F|nr:ATP synthase F(0) complex subunit B1, mitochondrial-like [Amblyraja radiata]